MGKEPERQVSATAQREEEIVAFWRDEAVFEKTLKKDAPNGEFVFYDGPPFATGLPHFGHLLISAYKDAIGRYKTMRGYRVPRRWGWDCHGLPIENKVEEILGLKSKKDIEELGIAKFNEEARKNVLTYVADWKHYIERLGRWVDFDNSYKTLDNSYIESVWWGLKKIYDDGRLYEGRKVLMYCPHCETPLSKAEIAMDNSYKDVTDEAVFVKFKVTGTSHADLQDAFIAVWTTTPWTLPANVALAVGPNITYAIAEKGGEKLVVAKERLEVLGEDVTVVGEVRGDALVGTQYEPLYEVEKVRAQKQQATWTVVPADFVTTEDGTGVVHIAPMYGEDDYNLGVEHELPVVPLLDATGTFNMDAAELVRGMYFKKGGRYVTEDLKERTLLLGTHDYSHSYPHCYRCGTALIYNALTSWFIDIQSVKEKLIESNEDINWYPEHLKHGRFKHNLESAPDWTISRNRFWASPLPIWKHEKTGDVHVFGSLAELRAHTKKSGNRYYVMRHGQADSNVHKTISSLADDKNHLTSTGREQVTAAVGALKDRGITKIIASPFVRTTETAEIVAQELGLSEDGVVFESRIGEWFLGDLHGKPVADLKKVCGTYAERFRDGCGTGETLVDMKHRIGEVLYEVESTYANETILFIGHEYTAWLLECVAQGADVDICIEIRGTNDDYIENAEVRELDFVPLPHNAQYELDLHRPYIDELPLVANDGATLERIPEVVDCWVESGAMSYAPEHYPMENENVVKRRYPADFIAEYIAQTRTWFYYMHALGILLFDAPSYKNCVTTGTVLAADGSKMSKSKGNFTDPLANIDQYGADALRYYLLSSVLMVGEDVAFKDEELREAHNRFINMLWNSFQFYSMHADEEHADTDSTHVLDRWILARLHETVQGVTEALDGYDTIRSGRILREFVTDLSTWFIRRSRDRFRSDDPVDRAAALRTSRTVFATTARLIAPVTPFVAENIFQTMQPEGISIHLEDWPELDGARDEALLADMAEVRRVASLVLEARQRAGIKVRQPLASVTLKGDLLQGKEELCALLVDEVNVKEVLFGSGFDEEVQLNTELTPELEREGQVRDLVRSVQALRKQSGLAPEDRVQLRISNTVSDKLLTAAHEDLARVAGVAAVNKVVLTDGATLSLDGTKTYVAIDVV